MPHAGGKNLRRRQIEMLLQSEHIAEKEDPLNWSLHPTKNEIVKYRIKSLRFYWLTKGI